MHIICISLHRSPNPTRSLEWQMKRGERVLMCRSPDDPGQTREVNVLLNEALLFTRFLFNSDRDILMKITPSRFEIRGSVVFRDILCSPKPFSLCTKLFFPPFLQFSLEWICCPLKIWDRLHIHTHDVLTLLNKTITFISINRHADRLLLKLEPDLIVKVFNRAS